MFKTIFRILGAIVILGGLCLFYGFLIEPRVLKTRYVKMSSANFSGPEIRIAFLSDIHVGSFHVPASRVQKIVASVNAERPDVVLISGDYIGGHLSVSERSDKFNAEIERGMSHLSGLNAALGVYSSLGNHDAWYGKSKVRTLLEHADVTVLDNAAQNVDDNICIVGLADFDTDTVDTKSFEGCGADMSIIVMAHSPDSFQYLRSDTAIALAGHTHGGQINIPLIGRRVTATKAGKKFAYGFIDLSSETQAFVTAGIGTSILPARFRAPPEIVIITLKSEN